VEISLAIERQTPARMLCQRVQHMIQKSNTRINSYGLAFRSLRSMALSPIHKLAVRVGREFSSVQIDSKLDFRLIRIP
jgi:hypothetical protein